MCVYERERQGASLCVNVHIKRIILAPVGVFKCEIFDPLRIRCI